MAREGSSSLFLSPKPAISISPCVGRLKVKEWKQERQSKHLAATPGMMISGATAQPSLMGFMIVYSKMWGYQLHDRPVLDTLIQPSETSSSNYQRLSWRSTYRARRVLLHAVNLRHGTDGFTSPQKESVLQILSPLKSIVLGWV
jgi:hypothetical protein